MLLGQQFRLGFSKTHSPATTAALHAIHEENPDPDENQNGQPQCHDGHKS